MIAFKGKGRAKAPGNGESTYPEYEYEYEYEYEHEHERGRLRPPGLRVTSRAAKLPGNGHPVLSEAMPTISDESMREMLTRSREYSIVLLRSAPGRAEDQARAIVWEHARRNFELRAEGLLSIVCPITDGSEWAGVGIFNAGVERTREIMEGDPGVQEGIFTYEVHACRSFPGDALPG